MVNIRKCSQASLRETSERILTRLDQKVKLEGSGSPNCPDADVIQSV
jgi:hypothetical protein